MFHVEQSTTIRSKIGIKYSAFCSGQKSAAKVANISINNLKLTIMKNFDFIESANVVLKSVGADLRGANKEYTSISRVLKDIQRKDMLKAGYGKVFEAVGLEAGSITPADFFAAVPEGMHGTDKKGNDFVGIWGWKTLEKDAEGKVTKREAVLRKVTAWTPNKLFKVLAQSQELNK